VDTLRRSISTGFLVLSLFTVTPSSRSFYAQAQRQTFPDHIFASTNQAQEELR
jgi:hypothetical protein